MNTNVFNILIYTFIITRFHSFLTKPYMLMIYFLESVIKRVEILINRVILAVLFSAGEWYLLYSSTIENNG